MPEPPSIRGVIYLSVTETTRDACGWGVHAFWPPASGHAEAISNSLQKTETVLRSRTSDAVWANQNFRRNTQAFVQFANHLYCQGSTAVEDLSNARPATDQWFEIPSREAPALHVVKQSVDRIRRLDRFMLRFEALDQHRQDIEAVSRGCPRFGLDESFDFLQRRSMVSPRFDWSNLHNQPQTVLTSTRSYA